MGGAWCGDCNAAGTAHESEREAGPQEQRVAPPQGLPLRPLLRPDVVDPEQLVPVRGQRAGEVAEICLPFVDAGEEYFGVDQIDPAGPEHAARAAQGRCLIALDVELQD